ncbi:MAG: hypothetical protein Q8P71_00680 [bacterium]|nr:hypothetical protein [bacterium]
MIVRSAIYGFLGATALFTLYLAVLSAISGWTFALDQLTQFWYFIGGLAVGFGIQIGLFTHLKHLVHNYGGTGNVLAVSGTVSTTAMLSCCAHYLVNILPVIGITGLVSFASQYQVEFFWVGVLFNIAGIMYIGQKIFAYNTHHNEKI